MLLNAADYRHYIDYFNRLDPDEGNTGVPNADAWDWLRERIPLFDCPDPDFLLTYYFRWWTFRKHVHATPAGRVITEFLPDVSWAGKYNTITMAAPLHIEEARWLRNDPLWQEYLSFFYSGEAKLYAYTCCLPAAALDAARVTGELPFVLSLYDAMREEHRHWENGFDFTFSGWNPRYSGTYHIGGRENGLFYTDDDLEGSEFSVGRRGYRPFLNACMVGARDSLALMADALGRQDEADAYRRKADELRRLMQTELWDEERGFYTVLNEDGSRNHARELYGYTPWLYGAATAEQERAWTALTDPDGFLAPAAMPFLEQCHPEFELNYTGHPCQWNGPSWPLSTSLTLEAMIRLLNQPGEHPVGKREFFFFLRQYVMNHRQTDENGTVTPCIEENLNPYTGEWIARAIRRSGGEKVSLGRDYNHSSCNNLIITGLCGLRPSFDDTVTVNPLLPDGTWPWFCLDGIPYHGHTLTIAYDRDGTHYGKGAGLRIISDGICLAESPVLAPITAELTC